MTGEVDSDDGFGARRDRRFDFFRIDAVGMRIDIHTYRHGAHKQGRAGSGDEGKIGYDDFISQSDAKACHGDLQSGRPVRAGEAVFCLVIGCKLFLEFQRTSPRCAPPDAALQNLLQRPGFVIIVLRPLRKC